MQLLLQALNSTDLSYSNQTTYRPVFFIVPDIASKFATSVVLQPNDMVVHFYYNRTTILYSCHRMNQLKLWNLHGN